MNIAVQKFIRKGFEWIVGFYIVGDQQSVATYALADQRSARVTVVDTPNTPNLRQSMALHHFCQTSSDDPRLCFAPPPLSIPPSAPTIESSSLGIRHITIAYPAPNIPPAPLVSASGPTTIHSGTATPVRRGNKRMIRSRPSGDVADTNIAKEAAEVGCLCKKAMPARCNLNETIEGIGYEGHT